MNAACRNGHPRSPENVYISPQGRRYCRACNLASAHAYKDRKKPGRNRRPAQSLPLEARFWLKVEKAGNGECWPWLGQTTKGGYGTISESNRCRLATHVSLMLGGKPRPWPDAKALHSCDNPSCVNPSHLRWGTQKENAQDCLARDRHFLKRKTHCKRGHPLSGANVRFRENGWRACRTCSRELQRTRLLGHG